MKVTENLKAIKGHIQSACERSGRTSEDITIVAVTKYVSIERAEEAVEAGILHLGENRDDGLSSKWEALSDKPYWHFIGSLQSRKVKNIIDKVSYIHSLDRLSLAKEIHKRAEKPVSCFVQVNVSGEGSKHGILPHEVKGFIDSLKNYSNIKVVGLMTMAPHTDDEAFLRSCFRQLKTIQDDVQSLKLPYAPCTELSMGMSNDYRIAIEEGATFIRIGTALVGND
ncbi:YggS family pyridoxal phosphate-dependent enzyme [Rossellomorea sp. YZS02]|uniref:YggS family pyridoxal phosphate-dependent enzyme n=1 Tax=Rossellomorea sp. YZS02 TaxID=3097358 RepID=UPI002A0B98C4|nr:YggS family pyridoxal phosphate-dependent enzyme [Rossellomorea sp. YZS02]MDX8343019.1 YggS family pyridoxal phosphate-dependent enzyme [Rossellomorea sp. YZS02]